MTPTVQSVALPGRARLEYVEQGDPAGVPVLFLHGLTDSWRSFERVLPHLPRSIRGFALSLRGHGDADRPAAGYQPGDFAADVVAFMDARGLERAVIVGHSMGSTLARRFALDHPERTLALVLMGSFLSFQGNAAAAELWAAVAELRDPVDPEFALDFQMSTIAKGVPQAYLDTVVQESLKVPARVWRAALGGLLEEDHAAEMERIRVPTLIVWGDRDAFCPRSDQDAIAVAIEDARLVVYPGAGHGLHWDEPERFASDLAAFVARIAARGDNGMIARSARRGGLAWH
jgi:pimeloyl-ACP methyl ester carboxylesterase